MNPSCPHDPFKAKRQADGVLVNRFGDEIIPMILRLEDVRAAAKDWETFSSDTPFQVPIPSEEDLRTVRQLPIETNPPEHTDYRRITEPFFRRPLLPEVIRQMENLVDGPLTSACARDHLEIVHEFALPLQSHALTYLLNMPEGEAAVWTSWGTHVFRSGEGRRKGAALEGYIQAQLDRALQIPGEDLFSALTRATFQGRPLTREEMMGFANLVFAGGRDTVINTVCGILVWLSAHPEGLAFLRENPKRIHTAAEEFVRALSPLTHIGRTCPVDTEVHGVKVPAGHRISLCFASANFDETAFEAPEEVRLDRKPNPHVAYGSGPHMCQGAAHARLIIRTLLHKLCERIERLEVLEAQPKVEREPSYERQVGYETLVMKLIGQ